MPGNIDDVLAPRSIRNIVVEVMEYVETHTPGHPTAFAAYDDALHAIWPELYKASPEAHMRVGLSIYADIAERWGFEIPDEVMAIKL